ncbi:hypothetical protein [Maribacter sp. 2307UL18-2]|uniref:hypothetical protein n=1 Tax=Maribacter sp. 2307UL18-2 TaxID=3386274 RepID=UPI0039BD5F7B
MKITIVSNYLFPETGAAVSNGIAKMTNKQWMILELILTYRNNHLNFFRFRRVASYEHKLFR